MIWAILAAAFLGVSYTFAMGLVAAVAYTEPGPYDY